jgi:hypothetical protein
MTASLQTFHHRYRVSPGTRHRNATTERVRALDGDTAKARCITSCPDNLLIPNLTICAQGIATASESSCPRPAAALFLLSSSRTALHFAGVTKRARGHLHTATHCRRPGAQRPFRGSRAHAHGHEASSCDTTGMGESGRWVVDAAVGRPGFRSHTTVIFDHRTEPCAPQALRWPNQ